MFSGVTGPRRRSSAAFFGSCLRIIDPIPYGESVSITPNAFIIIRNSGAGGGGGAGDLGRSSIEGIMLESAPTVNLITVRPRFFDVAMVAAGARSPVRAPNGADRPSRRPSSLFASAGCRRAAG